MHRIYSNYTDEEYSQIGEAAQKVGMTISAFCKMAVTEKVFGKIYNSSAELIAILHDKINNLEKGETFVVSDLFHKDVWSELTRSEKNTLSKQLAKHVRENPANYSVNEILLGKITQYKKT